MWIAALSALALVVLVLWSAADDLRAADEYKAPAGDGDSE